MARTRRHAAGGQLSRGRANRHSRLHGQDPLHPQAAASPGGLALQAALRGQGAAVGAAAARQPVDELIDDSSIITAIGDVQGTGKELHELLMHGEGEILSMQVASWT
eukprot:TRINITY_DN8724_c0_g1_i3.p1 TRINITY_DN8724_c0_g1~~TRINITY_DN8724_c0_g1_i3.p1  ORF type:complete len:107 (+),score=10.78 TRINITY_DN8724_c0_g1_i3:127-447(+)